MSEEQLKDHENRLRGLEDFAARAKGSFAAIMIEIPVVVALASVFLAWALRKGA